MSTSVYYESDMVQKLKDEYGFLKASDRLADVDTVELTGVQFQAKVGWLLREPNNEYIVRELEWYKSMSRNVNDIPGETPKIWRDVSDLFGNINSNYGWCIDSVDNGYQYDTVAQELADNPLSRRAVMYYTRPTMHRDQSINGMNDHMCTTYVQYFIRREKLEAHVYMRSNDAVFGYNNDYAWQYHTHTRLLRDLRQAYRHLELGEMTWNVGSLHVYPRHYNLLETS